MMGGPVHKKRAPHTLNFLWRTETLCFFLLFSFLGTGCAPTTSLIQSTNMLQSGAEPPTVTSKSTQYFLLAKFYSQNQDGKKAIEEYKKAIQADPDSSFLHLHLAQEFLQQGEIQKAQEFCQKAVDLDPDHVEASLMLAGIYTVYQKPLEALSIYRGISQKHPKNREALLHYGNALMEAGKPQKAKEVFQKTLRLGSPVEEEEKIKSSLVLYHLAKVELKLGSIKNTIRFLKKAIEKQPSFLRASLLLAQLYVYQGKKDKFLQTLQASYEERPTLLVANRLFSYYVGVSKWEKSIPYAETLVGENPDNIEMRLRLARIYQKANWLEKAKKLFHEIYLEFPQREEVLYYLGDLYMKQEQYAKALDFFLKIKDSYGHYEEVVLQVADCYRAMEERNKARIFLEKVMQKKKDFRYLHVALARIYEEEKKIAKAVAVLERHRDKVYASEASLYFLGFLYGELGEVETSLEVMEAILKINPKNADALNYIGYTLLELEDDYEEAGNRLKLAIQLKPKDAYIMDSYAWFLFKKGDAQSALKMLLEASALQPQEGVIMEHLADVYLQLGQEDKALESYKRSLSILSKTTDQFRVRTKILGLEKSLYRQDRLPASQVSY